MENKLRREMNRYQAYFPYYKVSGFIMPDGTIEVFANCTFAQANNFHRKNPQAVLYRF